MDTARVRKGDRWSISLRFEQVPSAVLPLEQNLIANPNLTLNPDGRTAEGWDLSGVTPPITTARNVDISEDFASSALEIADAADDSETFMQAQKIPVVDLRYTVSAWMNRKAGTRHCAGFVEFLDANGANIPPEVGHPEWATYGTTYYYFGYTNNPTKNNRNKKGSVTFGPGSTTYIPPAAHRRRVR